MVLEMKMARSSGVWWPFWVLIPASLYTNSNLMWFRINYDWWVQSKKGLFFWLFSACLYHKIPRLDMRLSYTFLFITIYVYFYCLPYHIIHTHQIQISAPINFGKTANIILNNGNKLKLDHVLKTKHPKVPL